MPVNSAFHLSNFGDCCIFVTLSIDAELQYKFRRLRAYLYSQALRSSIPRSAEPRHDEIARLRQGECGVREAPLAARGRLHFRRAGDTRFFIAGEGLRGRGALGKGVA